MTTDHARFVLDRYRSEPAALRYASLHRDHRRHAREANCIRRALQGLPPGFRVLDLPCGTGRMFPALAATGARITAADGSEAMAHRAAEEAAEVSAVVEVRVEDVFRTRFEDRAFDAVVCNRLLHHFPDADDRRAILRELARISAGPVAVSFFCSRSLESLRSRIARALGKPASERNAISPTSLRDDMDAAGLRILRWIPTLWPISQQCYAVATRADLST